MTEPEPINHNELKRLLIETQLDIIGTLFLPGYHERAQVDALVDRIIKKIDTAILDGDDS